MIKKIENLVYLAHVLAVTYACYANYVSISVGVHFLMALSLIRFFFLNAEVDMVLFFYKYFWKKLGHLNGKVIWITGASTGIGEAVALKLAEGNVKLIVSARSEDKLTKLKSSCLAKGNLKEEDVLVLPFDMTHYDKHEWALKTAVENFGKVDILVSNAGRSQRAHWDNIEKSVDEAMFDLNVFSLLTLARLVNKHFRENGQGHHVVMSSVAGKFGIPMSASYTGSKHALMGYFECLRAEQGSKGISITILCPGPVESNLMEGCLSDQLGKKVNQTRSGKLMSAGKCAEYAVVAIANTISEAWICHQPGLFFLYLTQYHPTLMRWMMNTIDFSSIAMKIRDGKTDIAESSEKKEK